MEPSEMTDILNPLIDEQADYVKGNRFGHPDVFKHMPLVRFLGTATLTRATRWATGYRTLEDSQCGYTAISAALYIVYPSTLYILAMVFERLTDQIGADQWASFSKDGDPHLRAEYVKNENPSGDLPLVKASDDGDFEAYI